MSKKLLYTSPEVDVFAVQTEGVVCQSGDAPEYGDPGLPGAILGDGGIFDLL